MTTNKHIEAIASKAAEFLLAGYGEELAIYKAFQYFNDLCDEMIGNQTERAQNAKEVVMNRVYNSIK